MQGVGRSSVKKLETKMEKLTKMESGLRNGHIGQNNLYCVRQIIEKREKMDLETHMVCRKRTIMFHETIDVQRWHGFKLNTVIFKHARESRLITSKLEITKNISITREGVAIYHLLRVENKEESTKMSQELSICL